MNFPPVGKSTVFKTNAIPLLSALFQTSYCSTSPLGCRICDEIGIQSDDHACSRTRSDGALRGECSGSTPYSVHKYLTQSYLGSWTALPRLPRCGRVPSAEPRLSAPRANDVDSASYLIVALSVTATSSLPKYAVSLNTYDLFGDCGCLVLSSPGSSCSR